MKALIPGIVSSLLIVSASSIQAQAPRHFGGGFGAPMPPVVMDHLLNLNDEQKLAIEHLQQQMRPAKNKERRKPPHHVIFELNPSSENYEQQITELANTEGERAKERVLKHAAMQRNLHKILTQEQRDKMSQFHNDMETHHTHLK